MLTYPAWVLYNVYLSSMECVICKLVQHGMCECELNQHGMCGMSIITAWKVYNFDLSSMQCEMLTYPA